jgi:hypothetical protein
MVAEKKIIRICVVHFYIESNPLPTKSPSAAFWYTDISVTISTVKGLNLVKLKFRDFHRWKLYDGLHIADVVYSVDTVIFRYFCDC